MNITITSTGARYTIKSNLDNPMPTNSNPKGLPKEIALTKKTISELKSANAWVAWRVGKEYFGWKRGMKFGEYVELTEAQWKKCLELSKQGAKFVAQAITEANMKYPILVWARIEA